VANASAHYKTRLAAVSGDRTLVLYAWSGNCASACCTDGFYYAGAYKGNENTDEVKASISTPFPRMCGEAVDATDYAHSNVYVGILDQAQCALGDSQYTETGFLRNRSPEGSDWGWYASRRSPGLEPETYRIIDPSTDPIVRAASVPHEYHIRLDVLTGTAYFYVDGNEIYSRLAAEWTNHPGDQAVWLAEIRGHETDMARVPGDTSDCWFRRCRYNDGLGLHDLDLRNDLYVAFRSDDSSEWKISRGVDSNSFSVRDLHVISWPPQ